jgi:hypothetical protein
VIWKSEFDLLVLFVRTFLFYFCIYIYIPIYTSIKIWSIIINTSIKIWSQKEVASKSRAKSGKKTSPRTSAFSGFCPGFWCYFLQQLHIYQNALKFLKGYNFLHINNFLIIDDDLVTTSHVLPKMNHNKLYGLGFTISEYISKNRLNFVLLKINSSYSKSVLTG